MFSSGFKSFYAVNLFDPEIFDKLGIKLLDPVYYSPNTKSLKKRVIDEESDDFMLVEDGSERTPSKKLKIFSSLM